MAIPDHTRRLSWSPAGHVITTNALHIPSWRARMSLAIQRLGVATSGFVKTKVWNALRGSTRLTRSSATASIFCYFLLACLFTRLHASKFKLSQAHGHIWTLDTIQNQGLPFLWRDILIILWCSQTFSKPFILLYDNTNKRTKRGYVRRWPFDTKLLEHEVKFAVLHITSLIHSVMLFEIVWALSLDDKGTSPRGSLATILKHVASQSSALRICASMRPSG